jgi:hypothetical protein
LPPPALCTKESGFTFGKTAMGWDLGETDSSCVGTPTHLSLLLWATHPLLYVLYTVHLICASIERTAILGVSVKLDNGVVNLQVANCFVGLRTECCKHCERTGYKLCLNCLLRADRSETNTDRRHAWHLPLKQPIDLVHCLIYCWTNTLLPHLQAEFRGASSFAQSIAVCEYTCLAPESASRLAAALMHWLL